jgi:hypothetical protein
MPRRIPVRRAAVAALFAVAGLGVPASVVASADAAGTVKASVSLTGPSSGVYGSPVTMSGTVWRTGTSTKPVNATIWLQRTAHGGSTWSNVTSAHSSSTGTFSFTVTQGTPYDYRTYWGGSATYTTAVSPRLFPAVLQSVRFDSIRDLNWTLGTLEATATVLPVQVSGGKVWLQRYNATTKVWDNYISATTTGHSKVVIRANVNGTSALFRIYAPQRFAYSVGVSTTKQFSHFKWRGAYTKPLAGGPGGTQDPSFYIASDSTRKTATLSAAKGGSVWGDLNSAGCTKVTSTVTNFADAAATVGLGGLSVQLAASATQTLNGTLSNTPSVRLQVADTTSSAGPVDLTSTQLLCAN